MKRTIDPIYTYEAVVVLGMNIRKTANGFRPTTYQDHDEFGFLAGEMNVIAATLLYEQQATDTFVFSTGTSAKTKATFGPDVPTEAAVYSQDFLQRIKGTSLPQPTILLEDQSVNTYSNLTEVLSIIREHSWKEVAIMSARYHIPRVQALVGLIQAKQPIGTDLRFIMAEDVICKAIPGVYDGMIAAAYSSDQAKKRMKIEAQGLQDMKDGKYVITEFQFHKPEHRS